jgi:hypothetical protein
MDRPERTVDAWNAKCEEVKHAVAGMSVKL